VTSESDSRTSPAGRREGQAGTQASEAPRPLLTVRGLSSFYGQATAIRDIDLVLMPDEIVAVLGHNGAGKSTLLRSIARVHRPIIGEIRYRGLEISGLPPSQVARVGLNLVREGAPVFQHLTVLDNLRLGERLARLRKLQPEPLERVWDWFPMLHEKRREQAGLLSGGQRQMLSISVALIARPEVLLLDEPSAGLAPTMAETVFTAIERLCSGGMAVILAEQDQHWVTGFVKRSYRLETGVIVDEKDLRGSDDKEDTRTSLKVSGSPQHVCDAN
jgi:branched-chain amino acid transport system ATP-binding protein